MFADYWIYFDNHLFISRFKIKIRAHWSVNGISAFIYGLKDWSDGRQFKDLWRALMSAAITLKGIVDFEKPFLLLGSDS